MQVLLSFFIFFFSLFPQVYTGIGTRFNHAHLDKFNKDEKPACMVKAWRAMSRSDFKMVKKGYFVAHKDHDCWTKIKVCVPRTGICKEAVVADWGPKRADIDLFTPLAQELKHNGLEKVYWSIR